MRILVVEDDARMAALLQRGLTEEGYVVDTAENGVDALWLGTENDYSAIVLDWMLPGLSGALVCTQLRERERWAPIIMLTARTDVADRIAALDFGADDHLAKPFAFGELLARLRALIRRGSTARPTVLQVADLEFDPATHRVVAGGVELALSGKERTVLEMLLRRPGQVLTRTQILELGWDFAAEPSSNIVDQYIGSIRRKIAALTSSVVVETVRGTGYRLVAANAPDTESPTGRPEPQ
jgi:two-component system OmpR family response regulator